MAFHKFLMDIKEGKKITIFGDGKQTRDFTYIDDIIEACIASLDRGKIGEIYNIGGGNRVKLEEVFPLLEKICQNKIEIKNVEKQKGDVRHTFAHIEKARKDLNYSPQIPLPEGLTKEWIWIKKLYSS
jgi:nucleoside-diphosphate-sugar epimerase